MKQAIFARKKMWFQFSTDNCKRRINVLIGCMKTLKFILLTIWK